MTLFLKLGGSLITDKTAVSTTRPQVLQRVAQEIATVTQAANSPRLLLGHGSGSFGHVTAAKYGTRRGVHTREQWHGFAEVSATAARLNKIVVEALQDAGVPALTLQPSASVVCENGRIQQIAHRPIQHALDAGLIPVIHGDVAFDTAQGGTIISTEEIMIALANTLQPSWLLLAGETDGVYDKTGQTIPTIQPANYATIQSALGGSRGTDVTGGMLAKVKSMLDLVQQYPTLNIRIFSGLQPNNLTTLLTDPTQPIGTRIAQG